MDLPFYSSKPDRTTIGRFRNKLLEKGRKDHLLNLFNQQLESNGFLVKQGVAVDAALIASTRRPRKVIDLQSAPHDRREDESLLPTADDGLKPKAEVSYSGDTGATRTVESGRPVYGCKAHAATDTGHDFVLGGHVTGANAADTKKLEKAADEYTIPGEAKVDADKGYDSAVNREMLNSRNLAGGIMRKARRGKPLSGEEKKTIPTSAEPAG